MESAPQMAMPSSPLENHPLLALESICEYLATSDSRRRSLFAFSLSSKRCCAVSDRQRFSKIRLLVEGRQSLESSLARCDDILRLGEKKRYVYSAE